MKTLKEIWFSDEYKEVRERCGDRLLFICFGGSHAYGTNVETSDIDIRGVMLPTKEELIGLKHFEQQLDETTDTCIYEVNKFVRLAMDCNPNVLEILACREYLIFNPLGELLINSIKLFMSKRCINTFCGYANAQLRRVEAALCRDHYSEEDKLKHMKNTMEVAMTKLEEKNEIFFEKGVVVKVKDDNIYLDVNIKDKPIQLIRATLNDLLTIEHTYNKIGQRNKKKEEKLGKHLMHLCRLYLMCLELLEKGELHTYRENDREFLLEIRNGKFIQEGKLTEEFYTCLNELEERLQKAKEETLLSERPNYKEIEKLVLDINTKVINNNLNKYKEPLELINL